MFQKLKYARIKLGHFRNKFFDLLNGFDTCGQFSVRNLGFEPGSADFEFYGFASTSISTLRNSFDRLPITPSEWVFVDLGCGKGRSLLIAAEVGFKAIIGVEHSSKLSTTAAKNAKQLERKTGYSRIEVATGDARNWTPPADHNLLIYMFNPFVPALIKECIETLSASTLAAGRRRLLMFVQQDVGAETRVDIEHLSGAAVPIPFGPLPFDLLAHPQLHVTLFEIRSAV